jgi:uncharacterized protein (TIGR03435 family)
MGKFRFVTGLLAFILAGDAQPQRIAFEVATIKPTGPEGAVVFAGVRVRGGCYGGPGTRVPGHVHCGEITIPQLIGFAYPYARYQIECPRALNDLKFEVDAIIPEGSTKEQRSLMFQTLLEERFKLKFHTEQKLVAGYELTSAKDGPAMRKTGEDSDEDPMPSFAHFTAERIWTWGSTKRSPAKLASFLTLQLGKPVTDATGLNGVYDITLTWADEPPLSAGSPPPSTTPTVAAPQDPGPSIFEAVQKLGLKLVSTKLPTQVFVVDQVEKTPTGN